MKTRLISAGIALLIIIPLIIIGGTYFKIGLSIIALLAVREVLSIRKDIPNSLKIITYTLYYNYG